MRDETDGFGEEERGESFTRPEPRTPVRYLFSVAAGVPPAVEPGILPGGFLCGLRRDFHVQSTYSGRQDAALYGSQDGCRYSRKPTLNRHPADPTVRLAICAEGISENRDRILCVRGGPCVRGYRLKGRVVGLFAASPLSRTLRVKSIAAPTCCRQRSAVRVKSASSRRRLQVGRRGLCFTSAGQRVV